MNQPAVPSQVVNTFHHLVKELEPFVKVDDLKIAFDSKFNVYILGDDFQEQLNSNFQLHRVVREDIRILIAKHRSQPLSNQD